MKTEPIWIFTSVGGEYSIGLDSCGRWVWGMLLPHPYAACPLGGGEEAKMIEWFHREIELGEIFIEDVPKDLATILFKEDEND
jgi:hypothetical protein